MFNCILQRESLGQFEIFIAAGLEIKNSSREIKSSYCTFKGYLKVLFLETMQ